MSSAARSLDIAIVGLAGRFPGAADVDQLWANLCAGIESIQTLSDAELLAAGVAPELLQQPSYVRARALLPDIERFDAEFFGYGPAEAAAIDPQQRLFLECAFEAFERAGYDLERVTSRVGVFGGSSFNGYLFRALPDGLLQSSADLASLLGLDKDFLTTRVSYKLNLTGPSVAVQTACSTSLVAVHLACQALLNGECELALAGGVSIGVPQHVGYSWQEGGIASPDGHCRPFDARAQGTVAGSGVGVVLLKRLEDALADRDAVVAVIKGSAINNDGRGKLGFTAPGVTGQVRVIREALALADVTPDTIGYVEAHGTATPLGDPVEVAALTEAFHPHVAPGSCGLGSLKSNLGHLDAAAGVAGLIKAALALSRRELPPSLHFSEPNPAIDFARGPFRVIRQLEEWRASAGVGGGARAPRRAAVSSFGLGGTNAHVVLEEAPAVAAAAARDAELIVLSARSEASLHGLRAALCSQLERQPELTPSAVAYTLQRGRRAFPYRQALVAGDREQLLGGLRASASAKTPARARRVAFLFPGQGVARPNWARALYEAEPVFRGVVEDCAAQLEREQGFDLRALCFPTPEQTPAAARRLAETAAEQLALFVLELALAKLWMSWGIAPAALLGHSLGEWVAACLAGCVSQEQALRLVSLRGRLMQAAPEGGLLAVAASEQELLAALGAEGQGEVQLAAVNGPRQCVLAGSVAALQQCREQLGRVGLVALPLPVQRAFHSSALRGAAEAFAPALAAAAWSAPRIPWLSSVSGGWLAADTDWPRYFAEQLCATVRFADAASVLQADPDWLVLEVGPGQTLTRLYEQLAHAAQRGAAERALPSFAEAGASDRRALLGTLGRLWTAGVSNDFAGLWSGTPPQRVALPATPFERQSYWLPEPRARAASSAPAPSAAHAETPALAVPCWQRSSWPEARAGATTWLVVAGAEPGPGQELLAALEAQLRAAGHRVLSVRAGTQAAFQLDGESSWRELLQRGEAAGETLGIVHAAALTAAPLARLSPESLAAAQRAGSLSVLALLRALLGEGQRARLLVLASGLAEVSGSEPQRPEHAPLVGLCRSVRHEAREIACSLLDCDTGVDAGEPHARARAILREALGGGSEPLVALRGARRWLPGVSALPAPERASASLLRERGVYVISGGLGGVGAALAESLARRVRARLVLFGRRCSFERERELGEQLAPLGAELLCLSADVTKAAELAELRRRALERFGAIHGVVHAAGNEGGGLLQRLSAEQWLAELSAKLDGALLLERTFAADALDFVAYTSSLTAFSGGLGQAGYAAANAGLDALARAAGRDGRRVISCNFDRWQGLGMAARSDERLRAAGLGLATAGLTRDAGQRAWLTLLEAGGELEQVLISAEPLTRLPEADLLAAAATPQAEQGASSAATGLADARQLDAAQLRARLEQIWQQVLGRVPADAEQSFFEQGGESLLALAILNRVRQSFGVELGLRDFFVRPTLAGLCDAVASQLGGASAPAAAEPALVALPRTPQRRGGAR